MTFGSQIEGSNYKGNAVTPTLDGGYLVVGGHSYFDNIDSILNIDTWIVKFKVKEINNNTDSNDKNSDKEIDIPSFEIFTILIAIGITEQFAKLLLTMLTKS